MPEQIKTAEKELFSEKCRAERRRNETILYYQLKLESCYLQSGSIKGDFKAVKEAAERITCLIKKLEKELTA